ncbi:MAG: fasciclin domain-containing protein [Pseudomonadota bacterium]
MDHADTSWFHVALPKRRFLQWSAAAVTLAALSACSGGDDDHPPDIVELAKSEPDLSILVEAVVAAGLVDTLKSPGPFTVFAPTNAAFAALLTELKLTKEQLLANKPLLTAVLTYHVLAAKVMAANIASGKAVTTVQGGVFKIDTANGAVITDGRNRTARIVRTDIAASNGVVHLIDRVLLPADKDIVATAQSLPDFSILVEAVVAAGLVDTLKGPGPFTVFAPTNAAFAALLGELGITKEALLANTALLTAVLTYHVVPGRVLKADVPINTPIRTVQGQTFSIDAMLRITDQRGRMARIVATDVFTSNGVIHVIDKVILPAA